ncbi:MAG: O-antigen ligase family protein [Bacilli bacterium]|nr:O-antigen ligase family protein [Bacilli bacterium]
MKRIGKLVLPIYIIINIVCILVCSYLNLINKLSAWKFFSVYKKVLIINIVVIIIMSIIRIIKKQKFNFSKIDIFMIFILIFLYISYLYAIRKDVALHGIPGRYEGLYTILYYFSVYFLSTFIDKKYKKVIVYSILLVGLINTFYAIFQVTNITKSLEAKGILTIFRRYHNKKLWATGFITNPNFFAALELMCLGYTIGLFIDAKKIVAKIIFGILIPIFMIGLLISDCLACLVALICVYIYALIYAIKNKKYWRIFLVLILLAFITEVLVFNNQTNLLNDFVKTSNETKEVIKGNIKDNYGSSRMFIWKNTLKIVPKNIINGVGIDNFYYAFGDKPLWKGKYFYDKAHNEYLQILICEGIFALISYLVFYFIIIFRGIKNNYKEKSIYLILPVIGYLIQAFFSFSVIEVAPIFYISLGLLVDRDNIIKKEVNNDKKSKRHNKK